MVWICSASLRIRPVLDLASDSMRPYHSVQVSGGSVGDTRFCSNHFLKPGSSQIDWEVVTTFDCFDIMPLSKVIMDGRRIDGRRVRRVYNCGFVAVLYSQAKVRG